MHTHLKVLTKTAAKIVARLLLLKTLPALELSLAARFFAFRFWPHHHYQSTSKVIRHYWDRVRECYTGPQQHPQHFASMSEEGKR